MKKSKLLDCQGNEFFPKQKGTPSLVKIEHKNTATLDSARSKKSKVAVLQLSVGEMLDELEWPSLEARRDQSSLLLFHKIHSGAVSIEKDKYLTPARSLKSTRSSHSAQYCRYQTYSDALKNFCFPRTIPQWNSLSPSAVNSQTAEEFRALLI